ncbi:hypothetical protein X975_23626, partial [Stegodyphus mimosarum]
MPGSLLLANDTRSELSDTSQRSLDSKLASKKVSFNKAVRVKKYPWRPDTEVQVTEPLILPSNRFWFKVYKSKETFFPSPTEELHDTWEDENMECIHDTLTPIAEVDDVDQEANHYQPYVGDNWNYKSEKNYFPSSRYNDIYNHPLEPPVDYFDDMHLNKNEYGDKAGWNSNNLNNESNITSNNTYMDRSILWHQNRVQGNHEIDTENNKCGEYSANTYTNNKDSFIKSLKLPRMTLRREFPNKTPDTKWNVSNTLKSRERRSRSHDDHTDTEENFKQLKKADKSVSTDDLNTYRNRISSPNRIFTASRDIATQCYGTLIRSKNMPPVLKNETNLLPASTRRGINSSNTNSDIVKNRNLKSETSEAHIYSDGLKSNITAKYLRKDNQLSDNANNLSHSKPASQITNIYAPNGKYIKAGIRRYEPLMNNKTNAINNSRQRENIPCDFVRKPSIKINKGNLRTESTTALRNEAWKNRENSPSRANQQSTNLDYIRGRQIPLTEVNTNMKKPVEINANILAASRNGIKTSSPPYHAYDIKSSPSTSDKQYLKKGLSSSTENYLGRRVKNGVSSPKSCISSYDDNDHSVIDWTLSGFQLGTKPENGGTSISDSEYTVHRRPPLLMYIPGVSHHDRPAEEDDRLSALSEMSRSELNDGLGSLISTSANDKSSMYDIRRRHSMPRDGKLKRMKWKK